VIPDDEVPYDLPNPDAERIVPPAPAGAPTVSLCYLADGELATVEHAMEPPVSLIDTVRALAEPPASAPHLRTAIGDPDLVRSVDLAGGIAVVDLRRSISTISGQDQLVAVAQIVCTLTGRAGVGQVSFTLDGSAVDIPRDDGSLVSEPVARDDYASLMP
jgi:spore germination protein GerM